MNDAALHAGGAEAAEPAHDAVEVVPGDQDVADRRRAIHAQREDLALEVHPVGPGRRRVERAVDALDAKGHRLVAGELVGVLEPEPPARRKAGDARGEVGDIDARPGRVREHLDVLEHVCSGEQVHRHVTGGGADRERQGRLGGEDRGIEPQPPSERTRRLLTVAGDPNEARRRSGR
jgi:hypothetical protein